MPTSILCRSRARYVGEGDVHWEEWSSGAPRGGDEKRPVVLLHGVSDSCRTWSRLAPALAASRRVYALDLPGHGRSARPDAPYDVPWYSGVVAEWIRSLGLDDFDLIGHSLGGAIALGLLFDPPARLNRLALIAAGGLGADVALLLRIAAVTGVVELAAPMLMGVGTHAGIMVLGGNFDAEERRYLAKANARPGTARALSRTLRNVIDLRGQREHLLDHAHRIAVLPPLAFYWGDRDPVIPVHHADAVNRYLEGVTVRRFAKAGHYPHRETEDELLPELLGFLDTPQPTPRFRPEAVAAHAAKAARSSLRRLLPAARPSLRSFLPGARLPEAG